MFFLSLKNNQGFKKYFKNTTWLLLEKILKIVSEVFVGVWVTRYLGPDDFGMLSYAKSFSAFFIVISSMGLNTIIVRELINNEEKRDVLLGTAFVLKLTTSFFLLISFGIYFLLNPTQINLLIFIFLISVTFKTFNIIEFYFQSKVLSKYTAYSNMILLLIVSILKVVLILLKASVIYFATLFIVESIILAVGFIYFYRKNNISIFNWIYNREIALNLLKDSWPLILSGFVITMYMKVDQIMIGNILDNTNVGYYAAAVNLSEAWYFLPAIIVNSLFPAILNAKKISRQLYLSRLQKLYDFLVWLGIVIAIITSFISDYLINLLYGKDYSSSSNILILHIWSGIFVFLGVSFSKFLISENFVKKALYRTLLGATANIILNFILIPIYGIIGAAIATIISQIFANYLYDLFDPDLREQFIMKTKSFIPIHLIKK
jgi:O-antigen/teichoic acid export membrane protein